jgi:hypothetical protein
LRSNSEGFSEHNITSLHFMLGHHGFIHGLAS